MKFLYDIFFIIFSIVYIPCLLFKGKLHREFKQKFGILPAKVGQFDRPVWIHAVSVGEAAVASKLAGEIKNNFKGVSVIISTTTKTGNEMVQKTAKGAVDAVFYYPLDISMVVSKVIRFINPRLYVMIETELWPNLLEEMKVRGIPVVLANGRISDKSFLNYKKIGSITRRILGCIDHFCMQSDKDAERIKVLGADSKKVSVTGNMKFDEELAAPLEGESFSRVYLGFSESDKVIVAGSTHPPEEAEIISIFKELKAKYSDLRLVLAPRHVERKEAVKIYIEKAGFQYRCFSDIVNSTEKYAGSVDIILIDTIGHLRDLYKVATVVFVGGSIASKGGQNPIEPARLGKPVVFGPHMQNFREIADIFLENEAAMRASGVSQLKEIFDKLLIDEDSRLKIAKNATKVVNDNSGALTRTEKELARYMDKK